MTIKESLELAKRTAASWNRDNTLQLGAALAYYAIFSLSPLLVIVLAVTGFIYRGDTFSYVRSEIAGLIGDQPAAAIASAIESVHTSSYSLTATVTSLLVLFLGASGVFIQLQNSMNQIWGVKPKPDRFWRAVLKQRLLGFAMILGVSFLLLVSLLMSAAVAAVTAYFKDLLPGSDFLWYILDASVSFAITIFVFAAIYKVLPDVHLDWNDVWVGGVVTALLFTGGKSLIGIYLGRSGIGSAFGAAASVFVILAWVYYSSQILYFGAEFTKVYSEYRSSVIQPVPGAAAVTEEARHRERGEVTATNPDIRRSA